MSGCRRWAGEDLDYACCDETHKDKDQTAPEDGVANSRVAVLRDMSVTDGWPGFCLTPS